jgi:hypothetical protein
MKRMMIWCTLVIALAVLMSAPRIGRAWDGFVCIGPCFDIGQGCSWEQQEPAPVTMRGHVKQMRLRYGGASEHSVGVPGLGAHWSSDIEMDWHLYFDDSRCQLMGDGSCDPSIKDVGYRHPKDEPTPIMEVMPIQQWKRESSNYVVYSSTDWHLWSMDMTNAFLLKPGVAAAVESFGSNKGDEMQFGADKTAILNKEALAQGWLVIDRPDDTSGHAHAEFHPFQSLAVKTSTPGDDNEWRYRISAFSDSSLHQIHDCGAAQGPRTIQWRFATTGLAKLPNKVISLQTTELGPAYRVAGTVTSSLEDDGKIVRVTIPLDTPDKFGAIWVGEVAARVSGFPLSIASPASFPKSVGYFDGSGHACKPCALEADCRALARSGCRRRYKIHYDLNMTLPPGFGHRAAFDQRFKETWYVNGQSIPQPPLSWGKLDMNWDVGHAVGGRYSPVVKVDETITDPGFNASGSAQSTVPIPAPRVLFTPPAISLKSKTADTLVYAYELVAGTNAEMASPRHYAWYETRPVRTLPHPPTEAPTPVRPVATGPSWSTTTTTHEAKSMGYRRKLRVHVDDAYQAESADFDVIVDLPQLTVSAKLSHDPALDGQAPSQLVPPLVSLQEYKYHTKWRLEASGDMAIGEDKANNIAVTWPVKYAFAVVDGNDFLASSQTAGDNAFELAFKNAGLQLKDCATVRISAQDAYGHTPSVDVDLCGGLTNEEADMLMAAGVGLGDRLYTLPRRPPGSDPVAELPVKQVDPVWAAARQLHFASQSLAAILSAKNRPFSRTAFHAVVSMAPLVAKLQQLDPQLLRGSRLGSRIYLGTESQVRALDAVAASSPRAVVAMYRNGFSAATQRSLVLAFPHIARVAAREGIQ